MINKNRITAVGLTGGLGNQLFQLAAGLSATKKGVLYLHWSLGKPRISESGLPEIASFSLPKNVCLELKRKDSKFASKVFGYMLRQGINQRAYEKIPTFRIITKAIASVSISIYLKKFYWIYVSSGVGFSGLPKYSNRKLLIGYFQSYIWPKEPEVYSYLKNLQMTNQCDEVVYYKNLAEIEKPLIVHIRLGDYKNEKMFGIPTPTYYANAISQLWSSGKYLKIWIFSDEPNLASKIYGEILPFECRWIPEIDGSAAKTLEVMRFGNGYVIANSTFSWWGAFLSHKFNPDVIAPSPWFKSTESPSHILPPNWQLLPGWE
jgi:hypothetical protein